MPQPNQTLNMGVSDQKTLACVILDSSYKLYIWLFYSETLLCFGLLFFKIFSGTFYLKVLCSAVLCERREEEKGLCECMNYTDEEVRWKEKN